MDLHFVPNLTFGWQLIADLRKESKVYFDVHLMIENPDKWVEEFAKAGADNITIHLEACSDVSEAKKVLAHIRKLGKSCGIALKPKTDWKEAQTLFPYVDYVLVMTVEPGFGGQAFIHEMLPKIRQVKAYLEEKKLNARIQVDGGVNLETAELAKAAGATSLVAGSALFKIKDPQEMKRALQRMQA